MKIKFNRSTVIWLLILLPYLLLIPASIWYFRQIKEIRASTFLIINKQDFTISQIDFKGNKLMKFPVAFGKASGNKLEKGDNKTPEGIFGIESIEKSAYWSHDFKDGKGKIEGAYGPYFIRLNVPGQKGIGIHGTHDDNSLKSRVSEGCIRMQNNDIKKLVKNVKSTAVVVIIPSAEDQTANKIQELEKPRQKEQNNKEKRAVKP